MYVSIGTRFSFRPPVSTVRCLKKKKRKTWDDHGHRMCVGHNQRAANQIMFLILPWIINYTTKFFHPNTLKTGQ